MTATYKFLIADDHPLVRDAVARVIREAYPDADVIEVEDFDTALVHARQDQDIDLILLDLNMPGMNGLTGLLRLRNEQPTIPVVIVSAEEDKQIILQAVSCGAAGFITKSLPRDQMRHAIAQVLEGNIFLPADAMRAPDSIRKRRHQDQGFTAEQLRLLTRKQLQVLEHMTRGESNKMIAYHLNIAETTVKAHVSAILRKLGVTSRVQAILSANDIDFSQLLNR